MGSYLRPTELGDALAALDARAPRAILAGILEAVQPHDSKSSN